MSFVRFHLSFIIEIAIAFKWIPKSLKSSQIRQYHGYSQCCHFGLRERNLACDTSFPLKIRRSTTFISLVWRNSSIWLFFAGYFGYFHSVWKSPKKSHFTISRAKQATFIFLVDIFEFSRQKSTLESKSIILMIFGAKIQIGISKINNRTK